MIPIRRELLASSGVSSSDPYFENVVTLLHGDGTNGGQNNSFFAQSYAASLSPGGYSVFFDGSGDYLFTSSVTISPGTGNFTMEAWVFPAVSTQTGVILDTRSNSSSSNRPCMAYVNNEFRYFIDGADRITSSASYPAGQWYHVAVVRNSGTSTLYVNGTSVGTAADTVNFSFTRFMVAADDDGSSNAYFNGFVSNVRYVSSAVYTSNFTPPTPPLTAISGTQLLTCQSATFVDNSPNNLTITKDGNTAIASATNGLALTRTNGVSQGSLSPYGSFWSNHFDGDADSLTVPDNAAFTLARNEFSIEAWIYVQGYTNTSSVICGQWGEGGDVGYWQFACDESNTLYLNVTSNGVPGSATSYSASGLSTNTWVHVLATREIVSGQNDRVRLFINGVLKTYNNSTAINIADSTGVVRIGRQGAFTYRGGEPFYGFISNLRIVKGSIPTAYQTSVTTTGTQVFIPPQTPLTAVTNTSLLTCQSNTFRDASSNNFTITRNNDVSVQRFSPFSPTSGYTTAAVGGSAFFNGNLDYLSMLSPLPIGTSAFTVEGWLYTGDTNFYWFKARGNGGIAILYQSGALRLSRLNVGDDLTYTFTWPAARWVHVAVSRSGTGTNQTAMFVNGTRVAVGTVTSDYGSYGIDIGTGNQVGGDGFGGWMSDVRAVIGTAVYSPSSTTISVPTAPLTPVTDTRILCNFTNASIFDNAMMLDWQTASSAQIDTAVKKFGTGSIKFDGDADCLYSPSLRSVDLSTGDFTIEFWVYWNSYGSDKKYIINYGGGGSYWQFRHDSTDGPGLYISSFTKVLSQGSNTGWSTGVWYHVALVRNGSNFTIYRNGTSVATGTNGGSIGYFADYFIGGMTEFPATAINGYIDEMRITRGVARYTSNFTPPSSAFLNK